MNDTNSASQSLVGTVLSDRYRIVKLLGEGGMGAVYLAEHTLMRKRVAIKVLHPEMSEIGEVVARFEREARVSAGIDHPNVALATDFGPLADGGFFLVLEFIEGKSLRDVLHQQGPLSIERSLRIGRQIADALSAAHRLGVVHRDLKPENVMLVEKPTNPDFVKILDFGIAKESGASVGGGATRAGSPLTQLGVMYGTPEYMSPEQALGQAVDWRADLYTVGVMLYEMISGARPFEAPDMVALVMQIITNPPAALSTRVNVPPEVDALVMALLEKQTDRRPQAAQDVVASIDAILSRYGFSGANPSGALQAASPLPPPSQVVGSVVVSPTSEAVSAATGYGAPLPTGVEGRVSIVHAPGTDAYLPTSMGAPAASMPTSLAQVSPATTASVTATDPLEKLVAPVRSKLPEAVRSLPAIALVGGATAMAIVPLLLLVIVIAVGSSSSTDPASVASASASAAPVEQPFASEREIEQARKDGPAAVAALADKHPNDPAVWRAAMREYLEHKQSVAALGALKKLVALAPKALGDDVARDVILAAIKESDEAIDTVFALLEGTPSAEAVDVIYELTNLKEPKPNVVPRAQKLLAKQEVRDRASPALKALITLKAAKGCEANYAALPEVKENGDARALPLLKPLLNRAGCSSLFRTADCNPCLRKDKLLEETIAAVEKRKLPTRVDSAVRVERFGHVAFGPEPVFERVGSTEPDHAGSLERGERDQAMTLFVRELSRRVRGRARRFDLRRRWRCGCLDHGVQRLRRRARRNFDRGRDRRRRARGRAHGLARSRG